MGKRARPASKDGEGQAKKNKYFSNVCYELFVSLLAQGLLQGQAPRLTVVACVQHAKAGLPMGKRGVLLTCMGGKEMQAGRDAVRILTQVGQASLWHGAAGQCVRGCTPARDSADGQACSVPQHCCPASSRDQTGL